MRSNTLHLLSWNVHALPTFSLGQRKKRLERVADEIERRLPELVLLQEVWTDTSEETLRAKLAWGYRALPGPGTGLLGQRTAGLLAFLHRDSSWSLENHAFHEFEHEASAWRVNEGDGLGNKGVQALQLVADRERVTVLNTHLQAGYKDRKYPKIRLAQIREVLEFALYFSDYPLIAVGDFNARPHEAEHYGALTRAWNDLSAVARETCGCTTHTSGGWVDYVFARGGAQRRVQLDQIDVILNTARDVPWSDHNGLEARVRLQRQPELALLLLMAGARSDLRVDRRSWLRAVGLSLLGGLGVLGVGSAS